MSYGLHDEVRAADAAPMAASPPPPAAPPATPARHDGRAVARPSADGADATVRALPPLHFRYILGARTDATSYRDATARVIGWARGRESRYVCVSNVHLTMEAYDSPQFQSIVNRADLVTPDGMPLVWALRLLGVRGASRVYGPTLMDSLLEAAAAQGVPVGIYGSTQRVVERLVQVSRERYPRLEVAYAHAPPFRPLSDGEDDRTVDEINAAGTRILFVGLGCPKQERWMSAHVGRIAAVMLGVGAAFDYLAGGKPQAPSWMQRSGLEWLFRLLTEPRRLWRRYLYHNPRFVALFVRQLLRARRTISE